MIVDLIIALEMLLTDDSKSEITHKLALRAATLLSKKGAYSDPIQIFENIKKIYSYRSDVVHGNHKPKTSKELRLDENTTVPIVVLAGVYLREIIKILCNDETLLNPALIDKLLLTNK